MTKLCRTIRNPEGRFSHAAANYDDSLNIIIRGKSEFHYRLSNRTQQKRSTCIEGNFDRNYRENARIKEIFQMLLIPIFINNDEDKL